MQISGASTAGAVAAQAIKDTAGADLIAKTLDKLNTTQTGMMSKVDADYDFQKSVLSAAGIGNKLDVTV